MRQPLLFVHNLSSARLPRGSNAQLHNLGKWNHWQAHIDIYSQLFMYFSIFCTMNNTQLYEWFSPSVRPSVFLSHLFHCSHHRIIMKLPRNDKSDGHAKGQGQRSKVKVTKVKTQQRFPNHNSSLNSHMKIKWCIKLHIAYKRCSIVFQGHPSKFKVTRLKKS